MAYKQTEGFQSPCDMSYCNDANFETVTTKSGQKRCLKKCNRIKANYITATSDQTICKDMSGTRLVKTVSRNTNLYSKLNVNGNNSCSTGRPATISNVLNMSRDKCDKLDGVFKDMNKVCYVCPSRATPDDSAKRKPVINAEGVLTCY